MAINIFSGNSASRSRKVNSASASSRAQAAKAAVGGNAVASSSGNTAVKAGGVLSKIGGTIGNIASVASKFLPGVYGDIASGVANLLNDPEWWESVPGEQITLNNPLMITKAGSTSVAPEVADDGIFVLRPAMAEIVGEIGGGDGYGLIIDPSEKMITQYLLPEIRKVVNAIPLQTADAYRQVLQAHVAVYATWRTLKKFDYLLKHGQTYLPNMNVSAFPVLQVENAAWLQSTINRIEEYLRANVRLPHTLCCYLAWRYGRIYKATDSLKAGLILYNAIPMYASIEHWNARIAAMFQVPTATEANQKANADLYNAYFDHDLMVEIRDDTQFRFDPKEFALRTNCDLGPSMANRSNIPVFLDSALDNATAFMASTVSTYARSDEVAGADVTALFPVTYARVYVYSPDKLTHPKIWTSEDTPSNQLLVPGWNVFTISGRSEMFTLTPTADPILNMDALVRYSLTKALDIYNKGFYLPVQSYEGMWIANRFDHLDISCLAYDMAVTTDIVLANEQVFAFANLVNVDRKKSMSYQQAEKTVAGEVANTIDKLDIATVATPSTSK